MLDHLTINGIKEPIVSLAQHYEKPVSEWRSQCGAFETIQDFPKDSLFLIFNKIESLDILIEVLQNTRKIMINNDSDSIVSENGKDESE